MVHTIHKRLCLLLILSLLLGIFASCSTAPEEPADEGSFEFKTLESSGETDSTPSPQGETQSSSQGTAEPGSNPPSTEPGSNPSSEPATNASTEPVGTDPVEEPVYPTREEILAPMDNDFLSRTATTYQNINGGPVTVYSFYRNTHEVENNPNFSQAVMLYECIRYKEAYPEEEVCMTLASFHMSVAASACLDLESPEYGLMKNLYDVDYTDDGYYRLSYLLVMAARKGIRVILIAPRDANPTVQADGTRRSDLNFVNYFNSHLSDPTEIPGRKVGDYLTFYYCEWRCYGDKAAADMMHNKVTTVSNFLDSDGVVHGPAIWTGSINVDGIDYLGRNGNDSIQTAVIVEGHEDLRRVCYNYTKLLTQYCRQEQVVPFRALVTATVTEQIQLLRSGRGDEIPADEQIVYIGSETDPVFELYFTPLGGDFSTWDNVNNPYIKYLEKLLAAAYGTERIEFLWNNVKYVQTFELADMIMRAVSYAFDVNKNPDSVLRLHLPGVDASYFWDLDTDISVNETSDIYHIKDFQLSYMEDGIRYYVSVLNSLNFHEGAMYHQTNTILIIKETDDTGNDFYIDYATLTSPDVDLLSRRILKTDP